MGLDLTYVIRMPPSFWANEKQLDFLRSQLLSVMTSQTSRKEVRVRVYHTLNSWERAKVLEGKGRVFPFCTLPVPPLLNPMDPGRLCFSFFDFSFCSIDICHQNYIFSQYISFSMFDYLQVLMGALPPIDFLAKSFTTTIIIRCREVSRTQVQIFCISILKFNYNHMIIFGNHICMATPFIFFNLQNNMWKDVNLTTQALKKCLGVNLGHFSYTFCFYLN
jgi:hypothetical protein